MLDFESKSHFEPCALQHVVSWSPSLARAIPCTTQTNKPRSVGQSAQRCSFHVKVSHLRQAGNWRLFAFGFELWTKLLTADRQSPESCAICVDSHLLLIMACILQVLGNHTCFSNRSWQHRLSNLSRDAPSNSSQRVDQPRTRRSRAAASTCDRSCLLRPFLLLRSSHMSSRLACLSCALNCSSVSTCALCPLM